MTSDSAAQDWTDYGTATGAWGVDDDPVAEIELFTSAASTAELEQILRREVEAAVAEITRTVEHCDAFDLIQLVRQREFPIVPVDGLEPGFDGSGAVAELIALVLLARPNRHALKEAEGDTKPNETIPRLHALAKRLIRLASFRTSSRIRLQGSTALARLAGEYQQYFVGVRGMQYSSISDVHDRRLFDRPEVEALLADHLGFTHSEFVAVRDEIQNRYSSEQTRFRDVIGEVFTTTQHHEREPNEDERALVTEALLNWMIFPGNSAAFKASDIAEGSGLTEPKVETVLNAFSIAFDGEVDPVESVYAFLNGRNPLSRTCIVRSGADHITPGRLIGADSFRLVVETGLKGSQKAWKRYDRSRMVVSEAIAVESVTRVLEPDEVMASLEYYAPKEDAPAGALSRSCSDVRNIGKLVESDALFIVADTAICLEVKAQTIAEAAKRGDLARLETETKRIFGAGASQARRLELLIRVNGGLWTKDECWLDLAHVREVHTIVVGLDVFGPLAVALGDLRDAMLLGDGEPPWVVSMHDLDVISKVLDRPAEFLHYLRRRTETGTATYIRGLDELDVFMLFMEGELYIEADPDELARQYPRAAPPTEEQRAAFRESARQQFVTTYTDPLDAWMYWTEGSSPFEATKPVCRSSPFADQIVDFLAEGRKPGWLRIGADLLGLADEGAEQVSDYVANVLELTQSDGESHTGMTGFAGAHGYTTFFVATAPDPDQIDDVARKLHLYMEAKKHQLRSDRSLGLLVGEDQELVGVLYLNGPVEENPELDEAVDAMGLQRTWE